MLGAKRLCHCHRNKCYVDGHNGYSTYSVNHSVHQKNKGVAHMTESSMSTDLN